MLAMASEVGWEGVPGLGPSSARADRTWPRPPIGERREHSRLLSYVQPHPEGREREREEREGEGGERERGEGGEREERGREGGDRGKRVSEERG